MSHVGDLQGARDEIYQDAFSRPTGPGARRPFRFQQVQLNAYIGLDGDIADECPKTTRQVKKKLRPCGRHPMPGLILAAEPDSFVRQKCPPSFRKR